MIENDFNGASVTTRELLDAYDRYDMARIFYNKWLNRQSFFLSSTVDKYVMLAPYYLEKIGLAEHAGPARNQISQSYDRFIRRLREEADGVCRHENANYSLHQLYRHPEVEDLMRAPFLNPVETRIRINHYGEMQKFYETCSGSIKDSYDMAIKNFSLGTDNLPISFRDFARMDSRQLQELHNCTTRSSDLVYPDKIMAAFPCLAGFKRAPELVRAA